MGYRKLQKMVFAKDGRMYNAVVYDREGVPIVREDDNYYYVEAPEAAVVPKSAATPDKGRPDYPLFEGEIVTPARSSKAWKFEDLSAGLPTSGQWRTNFDLFDMDADGLLDIVSPPPRLSTLPPLVFKFSKTSRQWEREKMDFEVPAGFNFGFGGVVAGDLDKNGSPDLVLGTHDGALTVAMNQGGGKFKLERRGLPQKMAAQGLVLVDLDGDGNLDLVAQSEMAEKLELTQDLIDALMTGGNPDETGYVKGFDSRAFFWRDGKFVEDSKGLWSACWGYSLAVSAPKSPSENPLYVSSCRSNGFRMLLYTYDRAKKMFEVAGSPKDLIENFAVHQGAKIGTYRGKPAAFVSYIKAGSSPANVQISGDGISIYYQTADGKWDRKRVMKRLNERGSGVGSPGLDVGDLDGDGLDDIAFADEIEGRIRVFFQTPKGEFEEMDSKLVPTFPNNASSLRIADVDKDGANDVVLMFHALSESKTRDGGFRYFRTVR
jgi:hypothetical protein